MFRRTLAASTVLTTLALAPAAAQLILQPTAAYVSSTTLIPITAADGTNFSSLSGGGLTIDFQTSTGASTTRTAATVGTGGWATWSTAPESEWNGTSPFRVAADFNNNFIRMQLSAPVSLFGFESEPRALALGDYTVRYFLGATQVGSISRTGVDGDAGARLFAWNGGSTTFDRIDVSLTVASTTAGLGLAQFRFAQTSVVPEPGTYALMATGLAGLGLVARRRRRS